MPLVNEKAGQCPFWGPKQTFKPIDGMSALGQERSFLLRPRAIFEARPAREGRGHQAAPREVVRRSASAARTVSAIGLQVNHCGNARISAGRTLQPDLISAQGIGQGRMTEPDPVKRQDVGSYGEIDVEARMLEADRDIGRLDQEPIILLLDAAEVKFDQHAAPRHVFESDAPAHPPQQDDRIEFARPRLTKSPASPPLSQVIDDRAAVRVQPPSGDIRSACRARRRAAPARQFAPAAAAAPQAACGTCGEGRVRAR